MPAFSLSDLDVLHEIAEVENALIDGFPSNTLIGSHDKTALRIAAERLNIDPQSMRRRIGTQERAGTFWTRFKLAVDWSVYRSRQNGIGQPVAPAAEAPPETPSDPIQVRRLKDEVKLLRSALAAAERRTAEAENHRENILSLTPGPARLEPKFLRSGDGNGRGRQAAVLHLSDLHVGETVNKEEVSNVNSYDIEIARKRIGRLFETASVLMTSAWPASDGAPERVNVLLGGDLISGHGLHPEHAETDGGTAFEQVKFAAEYISGGILRLHTELMKRFKKPVEIHCISVVGNHGRSTFGKPRTKLVSLQSYDTLVADFVEAALRHVPTIRHFQPRGFDAYFDVAGWPALLTHGDRMGSGGGQGFIGPMATIVKGHRKIVDTEYRQRRPVKWVFSGHFHTTGVTSFGFSNGSGVGFGEFSKSLRADPEPAQQNFAVFHERHGLLRYMPIGIGTVDEGAIYDGSHTMILPTISGAVA